jgi:hypothetical protein
MTVQPPTHFPNAAPLPEQVSFDRRELMQILSLYGRMVAAGEWRDYGISALREVAVFSIFRRTAEQSDLPGRKAPRCAATGDLRGDRDGRARAAPRPRPGRRAAGAGAQADPRGGRLSALSPGRAPDRTRHGAAAFPHFRSRPGRVRRGHRRALPIGMGRGSAARRDQPAGAGRCRTRPGRNDIHAGKPLSGPPHRCGTGRAQRRPASGRPACRPPRQLPPAGLLLARRAAVGVLRLDPWPDRLAGRGAGGRLQDMAAAGGGRALRQRRCPRRSWYWTATPAPPRPRFWACLPRAACRWWIWRGWRGIAARSSAAQAGGQPSQKAFESALALALSRLDPARPVVIEAESSKIGRLMVPPQLWSAICAAPRLRIEAPLPARAAYLTRAYADLLDDAPTAGRPHRPAAPASRPRCRSRMAGDGSRRGRTRISPPG